MNRQDVIWQYQDVIIDIYKEESLACLRGENDSYKIKDKPILLWHSEVIRKCKIKYKAFDDFKNIDDLLLYSDTIMHLTAQLYLYRPHINNPIRDAFQTSNNIIYPNNQNLEAKRYYMYSDLAFEKLYSYWDRIGDLIASFFPSLINSDRVYFITAFNIIPQEYHHFDGYKWLKGFVDSSYKQINTKRKNIVHYTSSDTASKYKHLFNVANKEEIEKWVDERNEIADFFKSQINVSLEGFYQTLTMLEEINKTLFKDID